MVQIENSIRVATLNVRGLASRRKQCQLYRLVSDLDLDILAVQETKVHGDDETGGMVRQFLPRYSVIVSHAIGTSSGCVLYVRQSLGAKVEASTSCPSGRLIVCDLLFSGLEWRVICLYAPTVTDERRIFFEQLKQYTKCNRLLIIIGDFNCVLSAKDKTSERPYRDASTAVLSDMVREHGLEDVAECLGGGRTMQYTHFQAASHARLDRAYVSVELVPICKAYRVNAVSFSDHCLVSFVVASTKETKRAFEWQLWKLNSNLLSDEKFMEEVMTEVEKMKVRSKKTFREKWENFKQVVKLKALERSSAISREKGAEKKLMR